MTDNEVACQFYIRTGTCAFGNRCKYYHPPRQLPPRLNRWGYPVRNGEKNCPFFRKHGVCMFGATCKFDHRVPTRTRIAAPAADRVEAARAALELNLAQRTPSPQEKIPAIHGASHSLDGSNALSAESRQRVRRRMEAVRREDALAGASVVSDASKEDTDDDSKAKEDSKEAENRA